LLLLLLLWQLLFWPAGEDNLPATQSCAFNHHTTAVSAVAADVGRYDAGHTELAVPMTTAA
jgi:hypothetical protein